MKTWVGSEDKALGPKGEGCEWVRTEGQQGWGGGGGGWAQAGGTEQGREAQRQTERAAP